MTGSLFLYVEVGVNGVADHLHVILLLQHTQLGSQGIIDGFEVRDRMPVCNNISGGSVLSSGFFFIFVCDTTVHHTKEAINIQ